MSWWIDLANLMKALVAVLGGEGVLPGLANSLPSLYYKRPEVAPLGIDGCPQAM